MSTRVLVVDDSAIQRRIIAESLNGHDDIEVVGFASDAVSACTQIQRLRPSVMTLDLEMPGVDGLTFLRRLMKTNPLPVVVCSSLTRKSRQVALEAARSGALDVISKPLTIGGIPEFSRVLTHCIRSAACAAIDVRRSIGDSRPKTSIPAVGDVEVIAIGASTGGTIAVEEVLLRLKSHCPPVLITQHIQAGFSRTFAERLNQVCEINVQEARDGDLPRQGHVLIAPGDRHMSLIRVGSSLRVSVRSGDLVCYQRPSVDVLFGSVARCVGKNAVGVILTGMGNDGAAGLLAMKQGGALTVAQDAETSLVYGMPKEAVRVGAVTRSLSLDGVGKLLSSLTAPGLRR